IPLPRTAKFVTTWLSTRGNIAVMIRSDGQAEVWSLRGMRRIISLPALTTALAAADDQGNRMILLDGEHNELVNLLTHAVTPLRERAQFCRGQWRAAAFSYDGTTAIGAAACGELFLWNGHTGKLQHHLVLNSQIRALSLAHDDDTLA